MSEEEKQLETNVAANSDGETAPGDNEANESAEPREPMPLIESRFMFVDIAALRAKQLRRGALPRVEMPVTDVESDRVVSPKLERIAMAEIDKGLIVYDFPDPEASPDDDDGAGEAEKES